MKSPTFRISYAAKAGIQTHKETWGRRRWSIAYANGLTHCPSDRSRHPFLRPDRVVGLPFSFLLPLRPSFQKGKWRSLTLKLSMGSQLTFTSDPIRYHHSICNLIAIFIIRVVSGLQRRSIFTAWNNSFEERALNRLPRENFTQLLLQTMLHLKEHRRIKIGEE